MIFLTSSDFPELPPDVLESKWQDLRLKLNLPVSMIRLPNTPASWVSILDWAAQHERAHLPQILDLFLGSSLDLRKLSIVALATYFEPQYIKALIERGADPNEPWSGVTPLLLSSSSPHALEIIQVLLDGGADLNGTSTEDYLGAPVVNLAMELIAAHTNHPISLHQHLKDMGLNYAFKDSKGKSVFHYACSSSHVTSELFEQLIVWGCDINSPDTDGDTPLFICALHHPEFLPILKKHGVNLNALNADGENVLHYVCALAGTDVVKTLLELGLDPNSANHLGETPLFATAKTFEIQKPFAFCCRMGSTSII